MSELLRHLKNKPICDIAQRLDEDYYGANGDLNEEEIRFRVMQGICGAVDHSVSIEKHEYEPALSLNAVASLLVQLWKHKDADVNEAVVQRNEAANKLRELSAALRGTLGAVDHAGKLLDRILRPGGR
jgi:hypothetical protein